MSENYMTPRQRVMSSLGASVPGMIAIPVLMATWAPLWVVLTWLVGYIAVSFTAWVVLLRTDMNPESWWSTAVGFWFGLIPISAIYWDPGSRAFFIAALIVVVSIASEVSSLPYVRIGEWRHGVFLSSVMVTGAGFFEVGWVALAMIPVFMSIVGNADRMRATKKDLERARNEAEVETAQAQSLAQHDELTGLLNRRGITTEIERVVAGPHTMLMIDADRFKSINDGHGYAAGDQVIRSIATVLNQRLGDPWVVGRQGGDEFVAVAPGIHTVSADVCGPVRCRVSLYGTRTSLVVGLSGGYVTAEDSDTMDRTLSKAGYAMRASKRAGGGLVHFDSQLSSQFDRMLELSLPSQFELSASSLTAEFQIIVDDNEHIVGCETLTRWRRADGSLVAPADFLPVLTENGQMPMVNEVMLSKGIEFAARFNGQPDAPFVAVNVGSPSLASNSLVELVASLLEKYKVDPQRLMIEITETERLGQAAAWEAAALELKVLGVQLAIDDFGAGYSNIERLSQLPISHLKFDRVLTTSVSGPLGQIVRGVVDFARETGIGIIGEGIETEAELAAMRKVGVRYFQGFHFGRPQSAEVIEKQITESRFADTA